MEVVRIIGGRPLAGAVKVSGSKNASLPMFAATLLTDEVCTLRNVPALKDIRSMVKILRYLGADVTETSPGTWSVQAKNVHARTPYELVKEMRASICVLGPLAGRLKHVEISQPGGCVIGPRPIDLHMKGLKRLGCTISQESGYVTVDASRAHGEYVFLGGRQGSTVTGTANLVMTAVLTPGVTHIDCAACEPEITALCEMLVQMGARIEGAGSPTIKVTGVERLRGCDVTILPDRIEAGTYLLAGAITGGDVTVQGARREHLGAFLEKLEEVGAEISSPSADSVRLRCEPRRCRAVDIVTLPFPGFATDLQAQFTSLLVLVPGISLVTERIYPSRFMHVSELQRMGANIAIEGETAIVKGGTAFCGAPVMASDLRASAALILAGLAATGETWVQRIYHLDRGYEEFDKRLANLGASIERLNETAMPKEFRQP